MFMLLVPVLAVTRYFQLTDHTAAMRKSLAKALPERWNETVELNVGPLTTRCLRVGLSFLDLPFEGHSVADALHEVQFGIYELPEGKGVCNIPRLLEVTDDVMIRRGFTRLLGFIQHQQGVAVYVSEQEVDRNIVGASVMIVDKRQLILGSGRVELDALLPLFEDRMSQAWRQHDKHGVSSRVL